MPGEKDKGIKAKVRGFWSNGALVEKTVTEDKGTGLSTLSGQQLTVESRLRNGTRFEGDSYHRFDTVMMPSQVIIQHNAKQVM